MNPRILKKLSKRADKYVSHLGGVGERFLVGEDPDYTVETSQKIDYKHRERWGGKPNQHGYFRALSGTVGYGAMVDYYEPEWEELDAYSILQNIVRDRFTDYRNVSEDEWPQCAVDVSSPSAVFKFADEILAQETEQ